MNVFISENTFMNQP